MGSEMCIRDRPPSVRGKACNMLLLMLLPSTLKGVEQKKFYDFAATYELDYLFRRGVLDVKVKVFAASMDTKGREELLGMYTYIYCHVNSHQNLNFILSVVCRHAGMPGLPKLSCMFSRLDQRTFPQSLIRWLPPLPASRCTRPSAKGEVLNESRFT